MSEHTNGPGPEPDPSTGDGASAGASAATGPGAGSSASTGDAGALPPFRYDARLANEIEHRWRAQWAAEGTFETPNPAGSLAKGFGAVADRPKLFVMDMF